MQNTKQNVFVRTWETGRNKKFRRVLFFIPHFDVSTNIFFVLYLLYNVMHVRYCWIYTNKGVNSCHFCPIPYFFSICPTVPYSALLCIRPRIPGDSIPSSRRVKQRFICTSLCRHNMTERGSHFLIKLSTDVPLEWVDFLIFQIND